MNTASFSVNLTDRDRLAFAELSGDWNPLHTDAAYAASTEFGRCVLHGAFCAGLLSRLAGMYLPGTECLLHGMRLRFVQPILPPVTLVVEGRVVRDDGTVGDVDATVREAGSGRLLAEGGYQYGRHRHCVVPAEGAALAKTAAVAAGEAKILVTGASGGLGQAVCKALGNRSLGVSRSSGAGLLTVPDLAAIDRHRFEAPLAGIVHCAWPRPDSDGLLDQPDPSARLDYHLTAPLRHCLALARLLRDQGQSGAMLVLVGSSFARPGRHAWRMPLYSLAKGLIPDLVNILALELVASDHRVAGITLDVMHGGMNRGLGPAMQQAHADRTLWGELPDMEEVALQVRWVLDNSGRLLSGAMLDLTGGALP